MTQIPKHFRNGVVEVSRESVRELFSQMKRASGPGLPWIALGSTKGVVMDNYGELVITAVIETINAWAQPEALPEDPVELVRLGYSAPLRVFVKGEPHGIDKVREGRWRIIAMVPLHIVLAEMLIFGDQNEVEIAHWDHIPSKPGLGLAQDDHIAKLYDECVERLHNGELAEADVSGYDFSLTETFFKMDAQRRARLAGAGEDHVFSRLLRNAHHVMTRSVFTLSDGRMYKQLTPGIMKSGRYVTSSTNSAIRVMLAHAIGARWCIAMGDDSLEEYVEGAAEAYARLGLRVKFYKKCSRTFEFCSHTFEQGVAYPSKPGKMLYSLLSNKGTFNQKFDLFQQWAFEMRHHPRAQLWADVITRSGWATQNDTKQEQTTQCSQTKHQA